MEARHYVPSYVERTSYGTKETNPYNKLFEERIIYLGVPVDDAAANDVISQMIALESMDPDRDISLYINSPGGSLTAMTAIYDTMQHVMPDIETTCVGQAASAAALLLAAGTPGKRAALPNARMVIHQPAMEGMRGTSSDLSIQAEEILRLRELLERLLAEHTGQTQQQVSRDIDRDKYLTSAEAREYGLIDDVLSSRKRRSEAPAAVGA